MFSFILFLICIIILGIFVPIAIGSKNGAPNWMLILIFGTVIFMSVLIGLTGAGAI